MPTSAQIRAFDDAVRALAAAEKTYQIALDEYRNSAPRDSQRVDRALVERELAQLAVKLANLQLGKSGAT